MAGSPAGLRRYLCFHISRPYLSNDPVAAEIGGALKNVMAIASGIIMGHGLGENARAALLTRGLAEMVRLGKAKGAKAASFSGLSGLGDLMLSATSEKSRNYALGLGDWSRRIHSGTQRRSAAACRRNAHRGGGNRAGGYTEFGYADNDGG